MSYTLVARLTFGKYGDVMTNTNPHALENLPPLDVWEPRALLSDFAAEIEMGTDAGLSEWSPVAQRLGDEILRRMTR